MKSMGDSFKRYIVSAEKGLTEGMREFERYIVRMQFSGRKSQSYGLNRFTGNAANSWVIKKFNRGLEFAVVLGLQDRAFYVKMHQHHEFGGVIRSKGKMLTVPIAKAAKGHKAGDFSGLQFIKRRGKPPLLVRVIDKGTKTSKAYFQIMFALVHSVKIPKRLYITEDFKTIGHTLIRSAIDRNVQEVFTR